MCYGFVMQPLLSREEVRALEMRACAHDGLSMGTLMQNAGRAATEVIAGRYAGHLSRVVVVGGVGNNGGDAWVVARLLKVHGADPMAVCVGDATHMTGDALENWQRLASVGVKTFVTAQASQVASFIGDATLIVDGLFGTGLSRTIDDVYLEVVQMINASASVVVALDIPSGVDANTGGVFGDAVRADLTVTFVAGKLGLYQYPGRLYAGDIVVGDIGVQCSTAQASVLEPNDLHSLPKRDAMMHKASHGHLLVIGGSEGKTGAPYLSGYAAMRMGAGLTTVVTRSEARQALDAKVVELMTESLDEAPEQVCAQMSARFANMKAAVIGPGLGVDDKGQIYARQLAQHLPVPAVLDADALTALGPVVTPPSFAAPRVLTPHPGEAARLLGTTSVEVQQNRVAAAQRIARVYRAVTVLKGAGTLVASPEGRVVVCGIACPALATAGSGDVLAGIIGALLLETSAFDAAYLGVLAHAQAGVAINVDRGALARDIADALPQVAKAQLHS